MRIAFITNNYHPYSAGVVRSIDALTQQLQKEGNHVCIVTLDFTREKNDPEYVKRIPSVLRFMYKKKYMAIPWCPKKYLNRFLEEFKPDLIHVQHPFLLGPWARDWARKNVVPVLFTYHTVYEDYVHYVPLPSFLVRPIVTHKVLAFCRTVDKIIVPSTGMRDYLLGHGITHTVVIPSPIRVEFGEQKFNEKSIAQTINLLTVSRFNKEKNIPILFEVLKELPENYHLTLVGYGDHEEELRAQAQPFGYRVEFVIKPSLEKLIQCYQQADLFLFSSYSDTQGLVLAEAMSCSIPVISLDGMGQRDILINGENGYIVDSVRDMAAAILHITTSPEQYQTLQRGAFKMAKNYYPEAIVGRLACLYKNLLFH